MQTFSPFIIIVEIFYYNVIIIIRTDIGDKYEKIFCNIQSIFGKRTCGI
jgi:hypothetical protein